MALRRVLSNRYFNQNRAAMLLPWRIGVIEDSPISSYKPLNVNAALSREYITSPDSTAADTGFFSRFLLQKREINRAAASSDFPMFLTLPVGNKLREKLKSLNNFPGGERVEYGGLVPPSPLAEAESSGLSMVNVRKVMRCAQLEKLRLRLREIPASSIPYNEFVNICGDGCENKEQGLEFAKMLDESGNVVVLGNVVLLRPEQVVESVERMVSEAMRTPNDPRRKQLEDLKKQKAMIDEKAQSQVRKELYIGLGYLIIQTLGFMRLTFWELSWDVMEPICFFVTSFHFALAYGFFLRTSKEPSFEGYFQRRFNVKQKKLMKIHNFDINKYNDLCRALSASPASYYRNSGIYKVA